MEIQVHDTAFMIAYYRAKHQNVSKDPYAQLWLRPGLEKWTDGFARQVSPHDEMLHCLRNRFFYDQLEFSLKDNRKTLLLNLGAGFSMYQYALDADMPTIEVDFDAIINYKQNNIRSFTKEHKLPQRRVHYASADITSEAGQSVIERLLSAYEGYRKIILIEGVFFFLTRSQIEKVTDLSRRILSKGDLLMCVSFEEKQKTSPVYHRLINYFEKVLQTKNRDYTALPHRFYTSLQGFRLLQQDCNLNMGVEMGLLPPNLTSEECLNEHFYVLERQ